MAIVGRPGPDGGWDQIDRCVDQLSFSIGASLVLVGSRSKLYEFFMSLKQPDGSFRVAEHMEVDVR